MFVYTMILWAYFFSNFFIRTRNAIIFCIICWAFFEIPYTIRDKLKESGENTLKYSTISPLAG